MSIPREVMFALNTYETALRTAIRTDTVAEINEAWDSSKLKKCEDAWAKAHAARIELEALIAELSAHQKGE